MSTLLGVAAALLIVPIGLIAAVLALGLHTRRLEAREERRRSR